MIVASWVFGGLLLLFVMGVVTYQLLTGGRPVDDVTHNLLGFLCATLAGLFAFFFTGTIAAQVAPGHNQVAGLGVQATGGMALFVLVLFWWKSGANPVRVAHDKTLDALARILELVDRLYPQVKAVGMKQQDETHRPYSVNASKVDDKIVVASTNDPNPVTITAADLKKLPPEDQKLIRAYEQSMNNWFNQWCELYPKRGQGDQTQQQDTETQLTAIARNLCHDLEQIFRHLDSIGKYLEDHYMAMRTICGRLQQANPPLPPPPTSPT